MMLKIMIRLYSRDPLGLKLHLDYWFDDSVKTSKSLSMRKFSQQVFELILAFSDTVISLLFDSSDLRIWSVVLLGVTF